MVAEWADRFETPLHVHLSEQVAENDECLAAYGRTPTEVLAEVGALTDHTSAVHATHLTEHDVARLGAARRVRLLLTRRPSATSATASGRLRRSWRRGRR